ncbi:hypothetical protein [Thiothrix subterranea]|uniref:hypothetical protein n=1 Tax=Thiothrix subterranea TaxID=2735563 RepID=UPI00280B1566|nr:hypothetical protein [Thiothrix subterranea]
MDNKDLGVIEADRFRMATENTYQWVLGKETCDLDKVRLVHLNGNPITSDEYDCIQRFIRLWRKTGWTIDETDKALVGLAVNHGEGNSAGTQVLMMTILSISIFSMIAAI